MSGARLFQCRLLLKSNLVGEIWDFNKRSFQQRVANSGLNRLFSVDKPEFLANNSHKAAPQGVVDGSLRAENSSSSSSFILFFPALRYAIAPSSDTTH